MTQKIVFIALAVLATSPVVFGQDFNCTSDQYIDENPIGTCNCTGHLWVAPDCKHGFFCAEEDGRGCSVECTGENELLFTSFSGKFWECRAPGPALKSLACPVGGYNICPSEDTATTPDPDTITENPLGECRCEGELWVSEGCSYAYTCNSSSAPKDNLFLCDEGQVVNIDESTNQLICGNDPNTCYGAVNGVGCPQPQCANFSLNPLGACGCEEQFWISSDCKTGFFCTTLNPDPFRLDGCINECPEGFFLLPNFEEQTWRCVEETSNFICPGPSHVKCDDEDPGENMDSSLCNSCDGKLIVSGDCRHGFYCQSRLPSGGRKLDCPEGQILQIDMEKYQWNCVQDTGICPGKGGFEIGCVAGAPTPPPHPNCEVDINVVGECQCDGQFMINSDCTQGFYCNSTLEAGYDGCSRTCADGSILVPDFAGDSWACISNFNNDRYCPGALQIECPSNDIGTNFNSSSCDCNGQVLVDHDCKTAFYCLSSVANGGFSRSCGDGEIIKVDFEGRDIVCETDEGQCPGLGGYKIGCNQVLTPLPPVDCQGGTYSTNNPLGTCTCDGHLWVNGNCQKGYYCLSTGGEGCLIECPPGQIVSTNFTAGVWQCRDISSGDQDLRWTGCPLGGYDVCPSDETPAPTPDTPPTENPLGKCRCDGEVWVSEGCSFGWYCNSSLPNGGAYKACDEGEVLDLNFLDGTWVCTDDVGSCPGGPILGEGCPAPLCIYSKNPLGNCECNEQLFINYDCTEGFWCSDLVPDTFLHDGCIKTCLEGQILIPNFANGGWECADNFDGSFACPGEYNLECPVNDIGNEFNSTMCDCNGQFMVSSDCRHGYYCNSLSFGGGIPFDCEEGKILDINIRDQVVRCVPDNGNCPGLGGFTIGCGDGSIKPTPPPNPGTPGNNTLGDCECGDEFFIGEDCTKAFYCADSLKPEFQGLELNCEPGKRVKLDIPTKYWECVDDDEDFVCPGDFHSDCQNTFNVECGCKNEIWVNGPCGRAYLCEGPQVNGINNGIMIGCPEDMIITFDFNSPVSYTCTEQKDKCFGSYHFGCGGEWENVTFTPPPTTTTGASTTTTTTTPKVTTTEDRTTSWTTTSTTGGSESSSTTTTMSQATTSGSNVVMPSFLVLVVLLHVMQKL